MVAAVRMKTKKQRAVSPGLDEEHGRVASPLAEQRQERRATSSGEQTTNNERTAAALLCNQVWRLL